MVDARNLQKISSPTDNRISGQAIVVFAKKACETSKTVYFSQMIWLDVLSINKEKKNLNQYLNIYREKKTKPSFYFIVF